MPRVLRTARARVTLAAAVLLLLASLNLTVLAAVLACLRPQHMIVHVARRYDVHTAILRPGPVYLPSHIDPATVRRPLRVLAWYEEQRGPATQVLRVQLDTLPRLCAP